MSKKDGINDKVNTITGKANPDDSPNNNDVHKHYEKALTTSPASRRDPSNARALVVLPKTQKEVTEKKVKERAEKRANRENRLRQNRNNRRYSLNNDNNYNNDDDDILNENQHLKTLIPNVDANSQSNDDQQQKDNKDGKDTLSHIGDTHYQGQLYSDILPETKKHTLNKNSKEYFEFLKNFVNHFDEIPLDEIIIRKAMVQDTIGQMFDNSLEGMNSFEKTTKQHQIFGQAAHLCQKILISLKHDDMPTANALIKRLIPKSKG